MRHAWVIDDNFEMRKLLAVIVEMTNVSPVLLLDGQHAIEHINAGNVKPSVILLDMRMPRIDGETFYRQMAPLGLGDVPVIVITSEEVRPEWLDARDGFICKETGLDMGVLRRCVEEKLRAYKRLDPPMREYYQGIAGSVQHALREEHANVA